MKWLLETLVIRNRIVVHNNSKASFLLSLFISLFLDSVVLEKEGLINFEHLGAQRQLINVLNCSTCDVVLDPVDLCKMAEIYGLLPPDQPSILLEDLVSCLCL